MVNTFISIKFGVNSLDGFRENEFYVRWTDSGRRPHRYNSSADTLKQS